MYETRGLFDGLRVGLLGGSFNPPHAGHREISLHGLRRIGLDYVWWLVTPGNPQKDQEHYACFDTRTAAARQCAAHPRIIVSNFEQRHDLRFTAHTIAALRSRFPRTRFVWMMGADNLAGFHTWRDWKLIAANLPIAVFNRPGHTISGLASPAGQTLHSYRLPTTAARHLPECAPPAWIYFTDTLNHESSTEIRAENKDWRERIENPI